MADLPAPVERALEAVAQGSGRTVVIAGPPSSGKSALLESIRGAIAERRWRIVSVNGSYRDRTIPYAALADFGDDPAAIPSGAPKAGDVPADPAPPVEPPLSSLAAGYIFGGAPVSGRSRRGQGLAGGHGFGGVGGVPRRAGRIVTGPEMQAQLLRWIREGDGVPVVVLIEDGSLIDAESRDALLHVSRTGPWDPILLVATLDVALPTFRAWEEQLIGRGDVDWVRIQHPKPDPRETERVHEEFAALTEPTQRLLVFIALLGGSATEVGLGRAARMGVREMSDLLAPAVAAHLLKAEEGRLVIPYSSWVGPIASFASQTLRVEAHRQIAEALSALTPEPDARRGRALADHLFEAQADPQALRRLLDAAEFADRLMDFDGVVELLDKATLCLPTLSGSDRAEADLEVRLWRTRALLGAGRVRTGLQALEEALRWAAAERLPRDLLLPRIEDLLPALVALGPRPGLDPLLGRCVDRLAEIGFPGTEACLEIVRAIVGLEGGRWDEARWAGVRAQDRARHATPEIARSCARILEAIVVAAPQGRDPGPGGPFHDLLGPAASRVGHPPLELIAAEVRLRFVERDRHPTETLAAYQKALPVLQRTRAGRMELAYQLSVAEMSLDWRAGPQSLEAIHRARELIETHHMIPPAPAVARLRILEGRIAIDENRPDRARETWAAVLRGPWTAELPPYGAEAIARAYLLERAEGSSAEELLHRLRRPDLLERIPVRLRYTPDELEAAGREARRGAGALPVRFAH